MARSLVEELDELCVRPGPFARVDLPVVHLIHPDRSSALLAALEDRLTGAVPHARVSGGGDPTPPPAVREILDLAATMLQDSSKAMRAGRLPFRRYALASWLLRQNLPTRTPDDFSDQTLRKLLRHYLARGLRRPQPQEREVRADELPPLPWYGVLLYLLLRWLPTALYGILTHAGRASRWYMRQRYLTPRRSADFVDFARRLTTRPSVHEDQYEVRKLVVHAFLEDLREAYTWRPWRWRALRRTGHPVLLVDDVVPGTVGAELVYLINDVRNDTGAWDPLLVIAAGDRPLPTRSSSTPSGSEVGIWQTQIDDARRRRSSTAWYVPVEVTQDFPDEGRVQVPAPKAWASPWVPAGLVLVLTAGCLVAYANWRADRCGQWLPSSSRILRSHTDGEFTQCVGVTDGSYVFHPELDEAQRAIVDQNAKAADYHRVHPDRPYVTVVFLSALTHPDADRGALRPARAELEGIAVAQQASRGGGVPVRVLLANAGYKMGYGGDVAGFVADLARQDPTVVGVVGLGQSLTATKDAMRRLEAAGLPMVGSLTSADEMTAVTRLYHQIAPRNRREAAVVAYYARTKLHATQVSIYYSAAPGDIYSPNLADDLAQALGPLATGKFAYGGTGDPDANQRGEDACHSAGLVFFAGRADDFGQFLTGMHRGCGDKFPALMAGDDVTRFVIQGGVGTYPSLTLDYVSFASSAAWGGSCTDPRPAGFYRMYHDLFGRACSDALDGRALIGYDALTVIPQAVENVRRDGATIPITPPAVWRGIIEINQDEAGHHPIVGATGSIDFGGRTGSQIPLDKAVTILRITGADRTPKPSPVLLCGHLDADTPGDPNCPKDQ